MQPHRTLIPFIAPLALCASLAATSSIHAAPVKVHLQGPVRTDKPSATKLSKIETYGKAPVLAHDLVIPYDDLEDDIAKALKDELKKTYPSGKKIKLEAFTGCPDDDINLWANYQSSFSFTKKGQPIVAKVGASANNQVKASVTMRAKVRVHGTLYATADTMTWVGPAYVCEEEKVSVPFDLHLEFELGGSAKIKLWPTLTVDNPQITGDVIDASPSLSVDGKIAKVGAKIGMSVGSSPLGLALGGPLTFSTIGALAGSEAEDAIVDAVHKHVDAMVEAGFNDALGRANDMVAEVLVPAVAAANAKKSAALSTKLPGVGKSVNQLMGELGASLEVHTVTPNGGVGLSGVLRMPNKPGHATIKGKARLTSRKCIYAEFMGGVFPAGFGPANYELEAQVGRSCSAAFSGVKLWPNGYLGANPQTALGSTADQRKEWKGIGEATFKGTMKKVKDAYECSFEVHKVPNTAIVSMRLAPSRGSDLFVPYKEDRFFVRRQGSVTTVLDNDLSPVGSAVVGGPDTCSGGGGPKLTPSRAKEMQQMLESCPKCTKLVPHGDEKINVLNPAEVLKQPNGKALLNALKSAGKGPRARGRRVKGRRGAR